MDSTWSLPVLLGQYHPSSLAVSLSDSACDSESGLKLASKVLWQPASLSASLSELLEGRLPYLPCQVHQGWQGRGGAGGVGGGARRSQKVEGLIFDCQGLQNARQNELLNKKWG